MKKPTISQKTSAAIDNMAAAWELVRSSAGPVLAVRPPGSLTIHEYAAKFQIARSTARSQLHRSFERGLVTRVKVALPSVDGKITAHWCFLPVKQK